MSPSNFEKISDFHEKFDYVNRPLDEMIPTRWRFLSEEVDEVKKAIDAVLSASPTELKKAKAHLLKELCDVLYVTYGTVYLLGADGDAAFDEVHNSNMSKTKTNATTKAFKGPDYKPANMERFV